MSKRIQRNTFVLGASLLGIAFTTTSSAYAAPPSGDSAQPEHDLKHPLGEVRRALHRSAIEEIARGARRHGKTYRLGGGEFVELERESEDPIWTLLGEFGDAPSPDFGGAPGPQRNQIPEPDRATDNTTLWRADFSKEHYEQLLFDATAGANSVRNYYIEQSSGRYAVYGDVENWVEVPYNATHYGSNWCGQSVCWTTWWFIQDTAAAWWQSKIDAGWTATEIDDYLSQFDKWDRYDYDGDGNFDEPDGYIDHFQAIHAGMGEEAGGGAQGTDAIWSHRWYVQLTPVGDGGPVLDDGSTVPYGGTQIGESRYWIGDYTIEPENGGVGVFAHEFAHDLGLPDLYDTGGGVNSTGFWTLMSAGSWASEGKEDIGSSPTHMGAWEKLFLGWLKFDIAFADTHSNHTLGAAEMNGPEAQALIVNLPDKEVTTVLADPFEGDYFYYSGSGDNLDTRMYRTITVNGAMDLRAQVNYDIEADWDYAYLVAFNEDFGEVNLNTSLSSPDDPNGQNLGEGISGSTAGAWVELEADLSILPDGVWYIGFRYVTDGAVTAPGFMVDAIEIDGYELDGAESEGISELAGFRRTTGTDTTYSFNAYVAEYRRYIGWDRNLKTGPYNFGFRDGEGGGLNWVERYPYQDGLLISYWDASQTDNNVSSHPGEGLILPIDAHPQVLYRANGDPESPVVQSYDSTFSLLRTDAITLHWMGEEVTHRSRAGRRVFNDNRQYWNPDLPIAGVRNPHTDTQIRIKSMSSTGAYLNIVVR